MVLVAALLVSRSCGETKAVVSQDEAVAIAKAAVDFDVDFVQIRIQKRGLKNTTFWLVGVADRRPDGSYAQFASVFVDARTGEVIEIRPSR